MGALGRIENDDFLNNVIAEKDAEKINKPENILAHSIVVQYLMIVTNGTLCISEILKYVLQRFTNVQNRCRMQCF